MWPARSGVGGGGDGEGTNSVDDGCGGRGVLSDDGRHTGCWVMVGMTGYREGRGGGGMGAGSG